MKVIVVYDSVFGNTEKIALTIGENLGPSKNVRVAKVSDVTAEQLSDIDLLVVGSPTRKFTATPAIRSFLNKLPSRVLQEINVVAFDTRISMGDVDSKFLNFMVDKFGYAAEAIAKKLQKKQGKLIAEPEGFIVSGTEGPLKEGEIDRAAGWAKELLST